MGDLVARIIIDIPDSYVDWARWAQDELAKGGLPGTQVDSPAQSQALQSPPEEASQQSPPDPWAAAGTQSAYVQSAPTSQGNTSTSNRVTKQTKNGDMVFELRLNNAPECNCGDPAARLTAPKKAGGTYSKWVCAKDAGSDWKQKCDFSEWGS